MSAALAFALGIAIGLVAASDGSEPEGSPAPAEELHRLRDRMEDAERNIAARDRTIARLRSASQSASQPEPGNAGSPSGPDVEVDVPDLVNPLAAEERLNAFPGEPVGTAVRSPSGGDRDWMWSSGTILPDRGQASSSLFSPSLRVNAENGGVSASLNPATDVESTGLVAIRFASDSAWRVVYRPSGSDGLNVTGGFSVSLRRAKDLADVWQVAARHSDAEIEVPRIVGCSTVRFEAKGARYTLVTCLEFGPDGKPTAVSIRDGR